MTEPFYTRHRGPFLLRVTRPKPRKPGFHKCEMLRGEIRHGEDVEAEARALLRDPRDTIVYVSVWSVVEDQHVMGYRKDDSV